MDDFDLQNQQCSKIPATIRSQFGINLKETLKFYYNKSRLCYKIILKKNPKMNKNSNYKLKISHADYIVKVSKRMFITICC